MCCDTREELIKMYPIVFEMCAEKGYNMTGRDHIIAYWRKTGSITGFDFVWHSVKY